MSRLGYLIGIALLVPSVFHAQGIACENHLDRVHRPEVLSGDVEVNRDVYWITNRAPGRPLQKATPSYGVRHYRLSEVKHDRPYAGMERPLRVISYADQTLSESEFLQALKRANPGAAAFLYVHGIGNSFDEALHRAAEFGARFRFDGTAIAFDWPARSASEIKASVARGLTKGTLRPLYDAEATNARASVEDLRTTLRLLAQAIQNDSLHLIAHSMGGFMLANAVASGPYRAVTLLSPDVDTGSLRALVTRLRPGTRIELYAADHDRALEVSRRINGAPRAGLIENGMPFTVAGMETIDMTCAIPAVTLGNVLEASNQYWDVTDLFLRHSTSTEGTILYDFFWSVARNQPARCRAFRKISDSVTTSLYRLLFYDGGYSRDSVPDDCPLFPQR